MELYVNERPVVLPAALAPVSAASAIPAAADAARLPQVRQISAPGMAMRDLASMGSNGTTGFVDEGIQVRVKRTDVCGVPPRGRPV